MISPLKASGSRASPHSRFSITRKVPRALTTPGTCLTIFSISSNNQKIINTRRPGNGAFLLGLIPEYFKIQRVYQDGATFPARPASVLPSVAFSRKKISPASAVIPPMVKKVYLNTVAASPALIQETLPYLDKR